MRLLIDATTRDVLAAFEAGAPGDRQEIVEIDDDIPGSDEDGAARAWLAQPGTKRLLADGTREVAPPAPLAPTPGEVERAGWLATARDATKLYPERFDALVRYVGG